MVHKFHIFFVCVCARACHLLQFARVKFSPVTHSPLNLFGAGPMPASLKLSDSGQIPGLKK